MSISPNYFRLLEFLGSTATLRDFHANPNTPGLCALRHDVDHDLDLALEMAHWEHSKGFRASYYVLPGTSYWSNDKRLIDKLLQLQDYGHEVGLHVNSMAEWISGEIDDVQESLSSILQLMRSAGVKVSGVAAHGDKRCYEFNVSNYWCFAELRPDDPWAHENGRTAEGPFEADMRPRLLYPRGHHVTRADGKCANLWSVSMATLGLDYHAWHLAFDRYFSDSGGRWVRTADPTLHERNAERWQVLVHPEHWRGEKKYYFFLSPARSGSRWLSEVLAAATPLHTRHEYILNQPFHEGKTGRKDTSDVWALDDSPHIVTERLVQAWEEFEGQKYDMAEVNVYLEGFAKQLKGTFPEARFVHLWRDPALIVGSLMDRDWYDTPIDRKHPRLIGVSPHAMSQFERCCQYIVQANSRLTHVCDDRIDLAEVTSSPEALAKALARLNIPYHSRLGASVFDRISNARTNKSFPSPSEWTDEYKNAFRDAFSSSPSLLSTNSTPTTNTKSRLLERLFSTQGRSTRVTASRARILRLHRQNAKVGIADASEGIKIFPVDKTKNTYISLGGSSWRKAVYSLFRHTGWVVRRSEYIECAFDFDIQNGATIAIYAISYSESGEALHRKVLGQLDARHTELNAAFTPHPDSRIFDLFVYIPSGNAERPVIMKSCEFRRC